MNPQINTLGSQGEALIKSFEKFEPEAYLDEGGVPTIAWGHTKGVKLGDTCTPEQGEIWFQEDTQEAVGAVNASLLTNVTQPQFDALVAFTFNVGVGAEGHSTLLKCVNARDFAGAEREFMRWTIVKGKKSLGLTNRRFQEQLLFASGSRTLPPVGSPLPASESSGGSAPEASQEA